MTFVLFACYFELPSQDSPWVTAQPNAVTCHRLLNLWKMPVSLTSSLGVLTSRLTPGAQALDGQRKEQIQAASLLTQPTAQPVLPLTATFPSARWKSCTVWPHHCTGWDLVFPPAPAEVPNWSTQSSCSPALHLKGIGTEHTGSNSLLLLIGF